MEVGSVKLISPRHQQFIVNPQMLPKNVETGTTLEVTFEKVANFRESGFIEFKKIQEEIFNKFHKQPSPPVLSSFAVTQTTLILRWDLPSLHPVELLRIKIFRDGEEIMSNLNLALNEIKITGLSMGCSYNFYMVIYTTAGSYTSNKISATTLTMEDLSGLNVCFGQTDENEKEELKGILTRLSASYSDNLGIITTHLVTSKPGGNIYDEAKNLGIPIVTPGFLKACELKKRIQPASSFALQPITAPGTDSEVQKQ